jgi:hypothetical protein
MMSDKVLDKKPIQDLDMSNIHSVKRTLKRLKSVVEHCKELLKDFEESNRHFRNSSFRPMGKDTQFALKNMSRFIKYTKELEYTLKTWKKE